MKPEEGKSYDLDLEEIEGTEELQQEMFEHFRFIVDKGQAPTRIDKYITSRMENTSRHRIQLAIDAEYVRVNDQVVKSNYKVKPQDILTILMPFERRKMEVLPEKMDLDIMYEDDHLMVINKPAGLVVHPGCGNYTGTLINGLAHYLGLSQEPDPKDNRMGVLVHRIDKDTSGTLIVAKDEQSHLGLAKQFFDHTIDRKYIAIVWGDLKEDEGTITGHVGRDDSDRLRYKVFEDGSEGKHAVTHYKVIERLGYVNVVECTLETGRTHQIRVHMRYLGHPLFNDARYGGDKILKGTVFTKYKQFINNCFKILPRQALHAHRLGFIHPITKKKILVESELPEEMASLIEKFRNFVKSRQD